MKRIILAALCSILLVACSSNEPTTIKTVAFHVNGLDQVVETINAPRRAPQGTILDDTECQALTDLYVFDGTTEVAHQTNSDPNFGTVTLSLTNGSHKLSFICTRSSGISVEGGIMSFSSVRPTFGRLVSLDVNSSTPAQSLVLNRVSGVLKLNITGAFPTEAKEISFALSPRYAGLNVTTLCGANSEDFFQRVSCASKAGQSNVEYVFNVLCPSLTDEYFADFTVNVYNAAGDVIYSVMLEDVRLAANTRTLLSGNIFTGTGATIIVNHSWNPDIVGNF